MIVNPVFTKSGKGLNFILKRNKNVSNCCTRNPNFKLALKAEELQDVWKSPPNTWVYTLINDNFRWSKSSKNSFWCLNLLKTRPFSSHGLNHKNRLSKLVADCQRNYTHVRGIAWVLKVYPQRGNWERGRRPKLRGSNAMLPHNILKFRVSEMPFQTISVELFYK